MVAHDHTMYCICNGPRVWAVLRLASAAVNQNQAYLKYHIYLQFPTSEFHNVRLFSHLTMILSFKIHSLYQFYFGRLSQTRAIYMYV